jgi:GDP-L-fucose synthase
MISLSKDAKIYVAGHLGMVGAALVRNLQSKGYTNIITRTRSELDLLEQQAVLAFLKREQPAYIFMAAAKVGGIHATILIEPTSFMKI